MSEIKIHPQNNDTVIVQPCSNAKDAKTTLIIKNQLGVELFKFDFTNDGHQFMVNMHYKYMRIPNYK